MTIYIRCFRAFAFSIEIERDYTFFPFLKFYTCNSEIIIDIPYTRITFTPPRILKTEVGNCVGTKHDQQGNRNIYTTPTRASENRSRVPVTICDMPGCHFGAWRTLHDQSIGEDRNASLYYFTHCRGAVKKTSKGASIRPC